MTRVAADVAGKAQETTTSVTHAVDDAAAGGQGPIGDVVKTAADTAGKAKETATSVTHAVDDAAAGGQGPIGDVVKTAADTAADTVGKVKETATSVTHAVDDAAAGGQGPIGDVVKTAADTAGSTGGRAVDTITGSVPQVMTKTVDEAVDTVAGRAAPKLPSQPRTEQPTTLPTSAHSPQPSSLPTSVHSPDPVTPVALPVPLHTPDLQTPLAPTHRTRPGPTPPGLAVRGTERAFTGAPISGITAPQLPGQALLLPSTDRGAPNGSPRHRHDPVPPGGPPPLNAPAGAAGSGGSSFFPVVALLALLALAAPAMIRRLREVPCFRAPAPFVCALERPG